MRSILSLSQVLPHPQDTGVHVRTYHTWRILAEAFDLRALCFHRSEGGRLGGNPRLAAEALAPIAHTQAFSLGQDESRTRLVRDHLFSVMRRRAYTVPMYQSREYARALDKALRNQKLDLFQLETLDLATYLPRLDLKKTICVHHNVESDLLARRADREATPGLSAYMRLQSRLTLREEAKNCPAVGLNLTVSEADQHRLQEIAPRANIVTVPNGVDTEFFQSTERKTVVRSGAGAEPGIVFTGGTMYFPNRDALSFFERDIWPRVQMERPRTPVTWVGRATPDEQRASRKRGIELTGRVPDIRPYVADAACFIVPLRVGGGTRLKLLEAWAMGKAVVTTSIGCEGLEAIDGRNCLIRDSPADFAEAIALVLRDEDLRRRLGATGRETVEKRYSWNHIGVGLLAAYEKVLAA